MSRYSSFVSHKGSPPIWFMRQAGRYQSSYRFLRRQNSFKDICYSPILSSNVAYSAVEESNLDCAILFSDILFSLEPLGISVDFNPSPCIYPLYEDKKYIKLKNNYSFDFQNDSIALLKKKLQSKKDIIGFIGGFFTLYTFFVSGSSKRTSCVYNGLRDGRYLYFVHLIEEVLYRQVCEQIQSGADCIAFFDTISGYVEDLDLFERYCIDPLSLFMNSLRKSFPDTTFIYYTHTSSCKQILIINAKIQCDVLGISGIVPFLDAINCFDNIIYGNIPPQLLCQEALCFKQDLEGYISKFERCLSSKKWKMNIGTGHGLVPCTKEQNLKYLVERLRSLFFDYYG